MSSIKKVAIVVVLASVVIGSAFGFVASSNTTKYHDVVMSADIVSLKVPSACPNVPANFTNWAELRIYANETSLNLVSLTAFSPLPSISVTISLNDTMSPYVYFHHYNETSETISVPLPNYWRQGEDVYLSVNYYYSGVNPTAPTVYPIGHVLVTTGALAC